MDDVKLLVDQALTPLLHLLLGRVSSEEPASLNCERRSLLNVDLRLLRDVLRLWALDVAVLSEDSSNQETVETAACEEGDKCDCIATDLERYVTQASNISQ